MGLLVGGSGGTSGTRILDAWEAFDGYHTYAAGSNAAGVDFASSVEMNTISNPIMFSTVSGAPGATSFDAAVGRSLEVMASGAAVVGRGSQAPFGMPVRTRFSLPGSPPINWVPRPRRFRVDFVARITVVGAADVMVGVGIDGANIAGGNNGLVCIQSRPAVNAGRWMSRRRLVTAGPLIDGVDTGISPANFHRLSIVYEEGALPRVRFLIDDREFDQIAGDANMPSPPAGQFGPFLLGKSMTAPAGTTAQFLATHFSIDEL